MTVELIIFDCDGVLVDSEPLANEELRKAVAEYGLDMSLDQVITEFVGLSMDSVVKKIQKMIGRNLQEDFLDRLQEKTFTSFKQSLKPVTGIRDILIYLQNMPHKTCVASSGSLEKMNFTLGLTGLKDFFHGNIFSSSQVVRGKPYPDLFLFAAEQMGCDPVRCLVIEDSLPGVQAAIAAGMKVVAYSVRGQDKNLASAGGVVISDMGDIVEYLI